MPRRGCARIAGSPTGGQETDAQPRLHPRLSSPIGRETGALTALTAMAISPARTAAFDILLQVEREDAYASELLHSSGYGKLSSADHGLATEIVMGVLRWRSLLDSGLARFSSRKL